MQSFPENDLITQLSLVSMPPQILPTEGEYSEAQNTGGKRKGFLFT
jgi:hypothetical protein